MIDLSEMISGNSIAARCDYVFAQMQNINNEPVLVAANNPPTLKGGELIFCKTDYIGVFDDVLQKFVPKNIPFHLVTHDSDYSVSEYLLSVAPSLRERPITWWGVNSCSENINPIPIGIANSYCKMTLKGKDFEKSTSPIKLLYVNHNPKTNPEIREPAQKMFLNKDWATVRVSLGINLYKSDLLDHKFILCPRGNGIDTHRLWEALYCGVIPIVVRHRAHDGLEGNLPILFVDSYEEVTESLLNQKYEEFKNKEWNTEMLKVSWWINNIKGTNNAN